MFSSSATVIDSRAPQFQSSLNYRFAREFVGRQYELGAMLQMLHPDGPQVMFLYGVAGSGKSALLDVFGQRARTAGATVVRLDCGAIEPTEAGLLAELAAATGVTPGVPGEMALRLGRIGTRVVLMLDTYELFGSMDSWLRHVFVPLLPDTVRLVLCGREEPAAPWLSTAASPGLLKAMRLDCLDSPSAIECLSRAGVPAVEARSLEGICGGLPLALTLAACLPESERTTALESGIGERAVEQLSRLYLFHGADRQTRRALEAASIARRVTLPLLAALLPEASPLDAHERLRSLPFVETGKDGLHIHDAVRDAIATILRTEDPQRYLRYRRTAYRHFLTGLRTAGTSGLWRDLAGLLDLLENSIVRDVVFPAGLHKYVVEPALAQDGGAILDIIARHEAPQMIDAMAQWWSLVPDAFMVVRDRLGSVAGFYCAIDSGRCSRFTVDDPLVRAWTDHLTRYAIPRQERALFLRCWLSAESGDVPSAVQRACWVDFKRKYLELRPNLRRVYLAARDWNPYAEIGQRLGLRALPDCIVHAGGLDYFTAMLDFGPSSVDGWLTKLVAAELGVEDDGLLDCAARQLVLNGRRVNLTKLEFAVMEYLQRYVGQAVTRASFLENVWEQRFKGGSNVVDVVIRALRKKLGDRASVIETVQGVGYRLRRES